jgi:hypothetical protein
MILNLIVAFVLAAKIFLALIMKNVLFKLVLIVGEKQLKGFVTTKKL